MYRIIAGLSILFRFFLLPNPFLTFENSALINIVAEPILYCITFATVGIFYSRGSFPSGGSILYLMFYIIHVGLLFLWSFLGASIIIGIIMLTVYYMALFALKSTMHMN